MRSSHAFAIAGALMLAAAPSIARADDPPAARPEAPPPAAALSSEPAQSAPPATAPNHPLEPASRPIAPKKEAPSTALPTEVNVMAGLTQWLLFRGGNVAAEVKVGRLALEVSHGQGLDLNQLPGLTLTSAERAAGAQVRVPWTTGFGVGVRLTSDLHVLLELKAHHFEVSGRDRDQTTSYTTFSAGPGVFYNIHLYKGLFLQPNARFWPNVASTLKDNRVEIRQPDGSTYSHEAHAFNFFANMNVGLTL